MALPRLRFRASHGGNHNLGTARFIAVAFAAACTLHAQPEQLVIQRLALHQFDDGPVLDPGYEFVPGETIFFSCRLTGYHVEKKEEDQHVKLSWQMRVLDPDGVLLEAPQSGRIDESLLPQDKKWVPKFTTSFLVPPYASPGVYRIPVAVKDEFAGSETARSEVKGEIAFRVRAHQVEPSQTLVTRNFQFLRNEDDRDGMRTPVYHPGDMVWARFDITGFKFGENHLFRVSYGLAVLNSAGDQLFSQPAAASETDQSFYPRRYVPAMLSLSLDQKVLKGAYTLVVLAEDQIGTQKWESRQAFQVE